MERYSFQVQADGSSTLVLDPAGLYDADGNLIDSASQGADRVERTTATDIAGLSVNPDTGLPVGFVDREGLFEGAKSFRIAEITLYSVDRTTGAKTEVKVAGDRPFEDLVRDTILDGGYASIRLENGVGFTISESLLPKNSAGKTVGFRKGDVVKYKAVSEGTVILTSNNALPADQPSADRGTTSLHRADPKRVFLRYKARTIVPLMIVPADDELNKPLGRVSSAQLADEILAVMQRAERQGNTLTFEQATSLARLSHGL